MSQLALRSVSTDPCLAGELLARAVGGDAASWRELVRRYGAIPTSAARRAGLTRDEAEDLSQRVWLRLVESGSQIQDGDRLPGWLATAARRECLAVRRQRQAAEPLPELLDLVLADGQPDVADRVVARAEADALYKAVAQLAGRERRVVQALLLTPPLTYREIAVALDIPVGSVGPMRLRALARLRTALAALREEPAAA